MLVAATGVAAAAGSTYDTGNDGKYAMDARTDDGTVTITVTQGGDGLATVSVAVDDESTGTTDADGSVTLDRPEDGFEVTVETDGDERPRSAAELARPHR